ncbi:hypothetical protein UFOVP115_90 [uncultured Caudovirales phage]|uniref:Uncharacterized protein n=1 Tax=uncultured Caudovirales phage TaxID=2100421 RepID=A0A6J5L8X4_9CAUD|nr:hypothetical protein UFOVP115_90 [uncultured Caudovirales phage]
MPLTKEQEIILEASRSAFGCGLESCKRCYPIIYSCAFCATEFDQHLANGEHYTCVECGYDNEETY